MGLTDCAFGEASQLFLISDLGPMEWPLEGHVEGLSHLLLSVPIRSRQSSHRMHVEQQDQQTSGQSVCCSMAGDETWSVVRAWTGGPMIGRMLAGRVWRREDGRISMPLIATVVGICLLALGPGRRLLAVRSTAPRTLAIALFDFPFACAVLFRGRLSQEG